jgi:hypothetical protein
LHGRPDGHLAAGERVIIDGYQGMSPAERLQQVAALNRALVELATARLRAQYGAALTPRELALRLPRVGLAGC